jgi:hypothetical protein
MLSHRREPGEDDEIGLHENYGIIQKTTNEGTREKEVPRSYFSLLVSNRPFRIYLCSYLITIIGEWLTYVASIELVERLLGSESESSRMYISFLVVCRLIPHFILIPISGTLADARDKRKSMIMLDLVGTIAPLFYLFALYFKSIPIIYIVTLLQATIAAMYEPCRSSILPLMVKDDEDMKKATTLAELTWSAMTAIGSGLGGVLVAHIGIQACFLLDSVSFFASALLLYSMGGTWYIPDGNEKLHVTVCGQIEDMAINGMKYVINNPFWPIVLIKFSLCLVYGGSDPLNVAFVENYPNTSGAEQSQMFGALLFSTGFGCLIGPIMAEPFTSINEPGTLLNSCALGFALQAVGDFALGYFISFEGKFVATLIRAAGSSIAWINSRVLLQVRL